MASSLEQNLPRMYSILGKVLNVREYSQKQNGSSFYRASMIQARNNKAWLGAQVMFQLGKKKKEKEKQQPRVKNSIGVETLSGKAALWRVRKQSASYQAATWPNRREVRHKKVSKIGLFMAGARRLVCKSWAWKRKNSGKQDRTPGQGDSAWGDQRSR